MDQKEPCSFSPPPHLPQALLARECSSSHLLLTVSFPITDAIILCSYFVKLLQLKKASIRIQLKKYLAPTLCTTWCSLLWNQPQGGRTSLPQLPSQLLPLQRREWLIPRGNGAELPREHGIRVGPREGVSKFQGELLSNHPFLSSRPLSNRLGHSAPRVQRNSNILQAHKSPRTEFALVRKCSIWRLMWFS